jgi:hypothetical protein
MVLEIWTHGCHGPCMTIPSQSHPPGFPKGPRRSSGATKANPMGRATRRSSASSAQDPWREMDGSMSHGVLGPWVGGPLF